MVGTHSRHTHSHTGFQATDRDTHSRDRHTHTDVLRDTQRSCTDTLTWKHACSEKDTHVTVIVTHTHEKHAHVVRTHTGAYICMHLQGHTFAEMHIHI